MSNVSNRRIEELLSQGSQLLATYASKAAQVECNLAVGQPEMDPSQELADAVKELVGKPRYAVYTPAAGSLPAREAVAEYFRDLGFGNVSRDQVAITNGARSMISFVLMSLCRCGDHVLWFGPGYTYADTASLLQLRSVMVPTHQGSFSPDLKMLEEKLVLADRVGKLGAVIINNPVNPTGRVWSRSELEGVAKVVAKFNVAVIADETYSSLILDGDEFVPFVLIGDMLDRTVTVGSGSKGLRAPAYRLGFAHGPKAWIGALSNVIANMSGCPNAFALAAAMELNNNRTCSQEQIPALLQKRQLILQWCSKHELEMAQPQGAFYAFINLSKILGAKNLTDTMQLADALLERGVGIVPGEAFGPDYGHWVRLSYAGPENKLSLGLQKIDDYISG